MKKTSVRWAYVVLYYVIAVAIALPFNQNNLAQMLALKTVAAPSWRAWVFVPAAFGPLAAAIVCYRLDHTTLRRITVLGTDRVASFLTALIPLAAFMIAGAVSGGLRGLLHTGEAMCLAVCYSLGEEAGWRGYLQDVLVPLRTPVRFLVVGVLWWAWHARFATFFDWTFFPLIVVVSAFLLGRAAEETRSLLVVASMHATIMLLTMNGSALPVYYAAGAVAAAGWILIRVVRPAARVPNHPGGTTPQ